jgi:alkylation response protein AidB-like acyl-CoA dehydrogenase
VEILDTWYVSGLRGTGSNDIVVSDVLVPRERSVWFATDEPLESGPLYAFPPFGLLAIGIAAVGLGLAAGAVEDLTGLAPGKTPTGTRRTLAARPVVQADLARAVADLAASRAFLFSSIDEAWRSASAGRAIDLRLRAHLRLAATHAMRTAASVVDRMYDLAGGSSLYETSPLQRRFRDVHAATQHVMVAPAIYELAGRILLGVDSDTEAL